MDKWKNQPDNIDEYLGFVYIIRHKENGCYYIGKKQFFMNHKRKARKGKTNRKHYKSESSWETYFGSSNKFNDYVKNEGENKFERIMLFHGKTKFELAYMELKEQMDRNVLFDKKSFNEIINVRLRRMK